MSSFSNLKKLGIENDTTCISMVLNDPHNVFQVVEEVRPDEIYNLAGQSSVGLSFHQPMETLVSIVNGTLNLLDSIRVLNRNIRFYNASSGECFGDCNGSPALEDSPFRPQSPYAVAKASAHWLVDNFRQSYGLFACSGILFNHESPLRPARFVTRKITRSAHRIAQGSEEKLELGNLEISRDWGWAPEYVEAMYRMLCHDNPEDFVIATGKVNSLRRFTGLAFDRVGLDYRDHVITRAELLRPSEIMMSYGNASKAREHLDWAPEYAMDEVVQKMMDAEANSALDSE